MNVSEVRKSTQADLTLALADFIEAELNEAVAARGQASLVVSGGSTPRPLFETLAQRPLPWRKITVTLADERWVDTSSKDSNEAMLRATLLQGYAEEARFIPLKNNADTAISGQVVCEKLLRRFAQPFDLIILGMGNDGHTASLFPGTSGSALDPDTPDMCVAIQPLDAPHERMSLTASALLHSRKIVLHIVGQTKWQVFQNAKKSGPTDELPVRIILHQHQAPVKVYWCP